MILEVAYKNRRCTICPAVHINADTTAMKCVIDSHMTNRHMVMGVASVKVISTIALCLIFLTKKNIERWYIH